MARFVILEHCWQGGHWDLMLERAGVLRTWAIDTPMVGGLELAARALGDHRLAYLDYEGPVSGERGTVRRVDHGTYVERVWTADRVEVELAGAQVSGIAELWRVVAAGDSETPLGVWRLRLGKAD